MICFEVSAKLAMFTDPISKIGGEFVSYPIPPPSALVGIIESIYWKPTIRWVIDSYRVMNEIQYYNQGVKHIKINNGASDIFNQSYLYDVKYQVCAHFEWNAEREDLKEDRNEGKHLAIINRRINACNNIVVLGTNECAAQVRPCEFGEGCSFYDNKDMHFGFMFHSFIYKSNKREETKFWTPTMKSSIIQVFGQSTQIMKGLQYANAKKTI